MGDIAHNEIYDRTPMDNKTNIVFIFNIDFKSLGSGYSPLDRTWISCWPLEDQGFDS